MVTLSQARRRQHAAAADRVAASEGEDGGGVSTASWEAFLALARDANFHLGCLVKAYEDCVAIQDTPREDAASRVDCVKRREETRRACVALHEQLMAHIHGTAAASGGDGGVRGAGGGGGAKEDATRRTNFFTECYNFTSSVERFKRALDRSMTGVQEGISRDLLSARAAFDDASPYPRVKDAARRQATDRDRLALEAGGSPVDEAIVEIAEAAEVFYREREAASRRAREDASALISVLRARAAEVAHARDKLAEHDGADLVGARRRRCLHNTVQSLVLVLSLASVLIGSVGFYYWALEGRYHAGVVYQHAGVADEKLPEEEVPQ